MNNGVLFFFSMTLGLCQKKIMFVLFCFAVALFSKFMGLTHWQDIGSRVCVYARVLDRFFPDPKQQTKTKGNLFVR